LGLGLGLGFGFGLGFGSGFGIGLGIHPGEQSRVLGEREVPEEMAARVGESQVEEGARLANLVGVITS
jgi:hypothetical protein